MKTVYEHDIGGDGGKAGLYISGAMVEVKVGYPVEKLIAPVLEKLNPLAEKLKEIIPGNFEDAVVNDLVVKIKAEVVKLITE